MEYPYNETNSDQCIEIDDALQKYNDFTLLFSVRAIFIIIYFLIFAFGMFGNCTLIYSIIRRRHLHSIANLFVANLGVSDVLLCLTAVPIAPVSFMLKRWYFGGFLCKAIPCAQGVSVLISSLSLCSIAADRYWNITSTIRDRSHRKIGIMVICLCWIFAIAVNLPLALSNVLKPVNFEVGGQVIVFCGEFCEELWTDLEVKKAYGTTMLFVQFLIPMMLMCFCYCRILQKVQSDFIVNPSSLVNHKQHVMAACRKRRVMYILILMVIAFVVSWLPLTLANIFRDYGIPLGVADQQVYFFYLIIHSLAMTSVIWNPILYFWMSKTHRKAIKRELMQGTRGYRSSGTGRSSLIMSEPSPLRASLRKASKAHFMLLAASFGANEELQPGGKRLRYRTTLIPRPPEKKRKGSNVYCSNNSEYLLPKITESGSCCL